MISGGWPALERLQYLLPERLFAQIFSRESSDIKNNFLY